MKMASVSDVDSDDDLLFTSTELMEAPKEEKQAPKKVFREVTDPSRPFPCSRCHLDFKNASHLQDHIYALHVQKELWPYECSRCFKKFYREDIMTRHLLKMHQYRELLEAEAIKQRCISAQKTVRKASNGVKRKRPEKIPPRPVSTSAGDSDSDFKPRPIRKHASKQSKGVRKVLPSSVSSTMKAKVPEPWCERLKCEEEKGANVTSITKEEPNVKDPSFVRRRSLRCQGILPPSPAEKSDGVIRGKKRQNLSGDQVANIAKKTASKLQGGQEKTKDEVEDSEDTSPPTVGTQLRVAKARGIWLLAKPGESGHDGKQEKPHYIFFRTHPPPV